MAGEIRLVRAVPDAYVDDEQTFSPHFIPPRCFVPRRRPAMTEHLHGVFTDDKAGVTTTRP